MPELWLLVLACAGGTYLWRALGVALSGRLKTDSELFQWVSCVAYAMIAALVSRIVFLPAGVLADSLLVHRLAACVLALVVFFATRRNLFLAVGAGVLTLMLGDLLRGF